MQIYPEPLLGFGQDGCVVRTSGFKALKAFHRPQNFYCERDSYRRLTDVGWDEVAGLKIPSLLDSDEKFLVVEIGIVSPPFLLDFVKAYLDTPPDYSPEVIEQHEGERSDLFEADQWEIVQRATAELRSIGIYNYDYRPGNFCFE